jgi:hypothetical protein
VIAARIMGRSAARPARAAAVAACAWLVAAAAFVVVGMAAFAVAGVERADARAILLLYPLFFSASVVAAWLLYLTLYFSGYRLRRALGRRAALAAANRRALQWATLLLYAYAAIAIVAAGALLGMAALS